MADNTDAIGISLTCSVCGEKFTNTQECLKHELLKHSLREVSKTHKKVQKRLNATIKHLNDDENVMEREHIKQQLNKCESGKELDTIFKLFCMNADNLNLIFTRIQTCLEREIKSVGVVRIYPFGSSASGLALRDCDFDIYLEVSDMPSSPTHKGNKNNAPDTYRRREFNRITSLLYRSEHFTDVCAIRAARVPIIKCKHSDTGFSVDINLSHPSSRENTRFIHDLVKSDKRIHEMMLFLKLWAKRSQVVHREAMTSYCLVTMVIFFLQQPRKLKNQANNESEYRILKSIKDLQENLRFYMVQGVNYAYDINNEENKPNIPVDVTTWDLIKQFFDFFLNYNFDDYIISPYYGKSVLKTSMTSGACEEYCKQLNTITQYMQGEPVKKLQIDRCMCIQDAFALNQNTSRNISPQNKDYILLCLRVAKEICENPHNLKIAQLYEKLLCDTIKNVNEINAKRSIERIENFLNFNDNKLMYTLKPSKAEVRAVTSHYPEIKVRNQILRCWCKHYVDGITAILTKVYRIDLQKTQPPQQKQKKLDSNDLSQFWTCYGTIDLWTNRFFQRDLGITFMTYQLQQTERLHNLRRQDPKYSVTLHGYIKLNVIFEYSGINIEVETIDGSHLNRKSPLRRFFNNFKNTLQSMKFEEMLNADGTNVEDNKSMDPGTKKALIADKK